MARIRLLTTVVGDGAVQGDTGEVLEVDEKTAQTWADGERAERVSAPQGEKNTAPPSGEKNTAPPGGRRAVSPPGGEQKTRR